MANYRFISAYSPDFPKNKRKVWVPCSEGIEGKFLAKFIHRVANGKRTTPLEIFDQNYFDNLCRKHAEHRTIMNLEDSAGIHHYMYDLPQGLLIDHLYLFSLGPQSSAEPITAHGIEVYIQENIDLKTALKLIDLEELAKS